MDVLLGHCKLHFCLFHLSGLLVDLYLEEISSLAFLCYTSLVQSRTKWFFFQTHR